jgi:hypothetical protein
MKSTATLTFVVAAALGAACGGGPPPVPSPADTTGPVAAESTEGGTLDLGAATVDLPAGWVVGEPSSSMRLAEAAVPGPAGDALLTVFFFGEGGGGGVEANLQRWAAQIAPDDGGEVERDRFAFGGWTVSTIAVEGTLQPSRMGAGPDQPVPGAMLVGAVLEGPGGPWFFKLTGPAATVAAARPDLEDMLRSARSG